MKRGRKMGGAVSVFSPSMRLDRLTDDGEDPQWRCRGRSMLRGASAIVLVSGHDEDDLKYFSPDAGEIVRRSADLRSGEGLLVHDGRLEVIPLDPMGGIREVRLPGCSGVRGWIRPRGCLSISSLVGLVPVVVVLIAAGDAVQRLGGMSSE